MFRLLARLLLASAVVAAVFIGWAVVRFLFQSSERDWFESASTLLGPFVAAVLGGALVGVLLHWLDRASRRRLLGRVEQHLAGLREDSSPNALTDPALAGVRREADALARRYRQTLAETVRSREKLAEARAILGQTGARERGQPVTATHLVNGSSRQRM